MLQNTTRPVIQRRGEPVSEAESKSKTLMQIMSVFFSMLHEYMRLPLHCFNLQYFLVVFDNEQYYSQNKVSVLRISNEYMLIKYFTELSISGIFTVLLSE